MSASSKPLAWPRSVVAKRAILWLMFLGPIFYLTYGTANYLASLRADVTNIALEWEKYIPFLEGSIIPYWSVNLFYVTTLFFNDTPQGVDRIAKRYLTCQTIAVTLFVLFPFQAIFIKPQTSGLTGFLFDALGSFDKPFNQAPSLHIALLVIIWHHWRSRFEGFWLAVWHFWCVLIAASVLTTFQHHFLDMPTGALLGLFALWLVPDPEYSELAKHPLQPNRKTRKLALLYGLGAVFFIVLSVVFFPISPLSLLWLWPALALAMVSLAYLQTGVSIFQKDRNGRVSLPSFWLLMPYRWGAHLNAWLWTRKLPPNVHIAGNVHLGRFPRESEINDFHTAIDLTGEMLRPKDTKADWHSFPVLDLTTAPNRTLNDAAQAIQMTQQNGKVLVFCALGMQRSAAAVGLWLVQSRRAQNAEEAIRLIEAKGRPVHLDAAIINAAWKRP